MSSFTDKDSKIDTTDSSLAPAAQVADPSRRRFSRSAIAGSAVLLSLGNRAAWGQTNMGCMSVATLNSFNPSTGLFISTPAQGTNPAHNAGMAEEIHKVANSSTNFIGENTEYRTIKNPNSLDGVCLIKKPINP